MKTVLVVDDEYDLLHTICATLELGGYEPIPVGNGQAALEAIEKSVPDLMITDVMMPYMSGYELVEAVRRLPHGDALPVVLMSSMDPDRHPPGSWNALLPKPFSLEALLDTMEALIGAGEGKAGR
jgi:CheY-like chemotaxis protein